MAGRTQYSDEFKADALLKLKANGGNLTRTAEEIGVPLMTLQNWSKGLGVSDAVTEVGTRKKGFLVDGLKILAADLLEKMQDEVKQQNTSLPQLATSFGIVVDKMRLLSGESTEITEHREVDHLRDSIQRRLGKGAAARSDNGVAKESPA